MPGTNVPGHGIHKLFDLLTLIIINAGCKNVPSRVLAAIHHHRCQGHQHNRNSGAGGRGRRMRMVLKWACWCWCWPVHCCNWPTSTLPLTPSSIMTNQLTPAQTPAPTPTPTPTSTPSSYNDEQANTSTSMPILTPFSFSFPCHQHRCCSYAGGPGSDDDESQQDWAHFCTWH